MNNTCVDVPEGMNNTCVCRCLKQWWIMIKCYSATSATFHFCHLHLLLIHFRHFCYSSTSATFVTQPCVTQPLPPLLPYVLLTHFRHHRVVTHPLPPCVTQPLPPLVTHPLPPLVTQPLTPIVWIPSPPEGSPHRGMFHDGDWAFIWPYFYFQGLDQKWSCFYSFCSKRNIYIVNSSIKFAQPDF